MSLILRLRRSLPGFELDVDLDLPSRGVTALFGSSGSGKTSCLRCFAGLDRVPGAEVEVRGVCWQRGDFFLPPHRRAVGYVVQEAALFPHLDVRRNLEYGWRRAPSSRLGFDQVVQWLDLEPLLVRRSDYLSGGERQRVAIGRALLNDPALLLLDEPLAALDRKRRHEILPYLQQLHDVLDIPMLYVSHSPDEVARLADHLVLLEAGRVVAEGALDSLLHRLDLPLAEDEEGGVVVEGRVAAWDEAYHLLSLSSPVGVLRVAGVRQESGRKLRCQIRSRDVSLTLSQQPDTSILNRLPAIVVELKPAQAPAHMLVRLQAGDGFLLARITRLSCEQLGLRPGLAVWAQIKAVALLA